MPPIEKNLSVRITSGLRITDDLREQYARIHREDVRYGQGGLKWYLRVRHCMKVTGSHNVLDYGCGKRSLVYRLIEDGIVAHGYDPGTFPKEPSPAHFITCLDVLEHVEPGCIDAVLKHLASLMQKAGLFAISTRPARQKLPDGRNAHLLVRSKLWWLEALNPYFRCVQQEPYPGTDSNKEYVVLVYPKGTDANHT